MITENSRAHTASPLPELYLAHTTHGFPSSKLHFTSTLNATTSLKPKARNFETCFLQLD